jgi:hypothetical protein
MVRSVALDLCGQDGGGPRTESQDATEACPNEGRALVFHARFLALEAAPPGARVEIALADGGPRHRMRVGHVLTIPPGQLSKRGRLFWTQITPEGTSHAEDKTIRILWSGDSIAAPAPNAVGVFAVPPLGSSRGQFILDGELRVQLPNVMCEEVAISSPTHRIAVGGSDVAAAIDGTGNGFLVPPGCIFSFAIDNASKVYVHGPVGAVVSFWIPQRRR